MRASCCGRKENVADPVGARRRVVDPVTKAGYELEFEDTFDSDTLDRARWPAHNVPGGIPRAVGGPRCRLHGGMLRLVIEEAQPPWVPGSRRADPGLVVPDRGAHFGPVGSR